MIERAVHGSLQGGYYDFGLKEGGIDYAVNNYNVFLLKPVRPILEDVKKKMIEGNCAAQANKLVSVTGLEIREREDKGIIARCQDNSGLRRYKSN